MPEKCQLPRNSHQLIYEYTYSQVYNIRREVVVAVVNYSTGTIRLTELYV